MVCPDCRGTKVVHALVDCVDKRQSGPRILPCSTCKGSGEITEEHAAAIAEGRRLRGDRVMRRVSQREEAARLGIDVLELNARERGRLA